MFEIEDMVVDKPLYSGLFVPQLTPDELRQVYKIALDSGAKGVSLFALGSLKEAHWKVVSEFKK